MILSRETECEWVNLVLKSLVAIDINTNIEKQIKKYLDERCVFSYEIYM